MIKNIIIAAVGFAAGAVTGVAAASSYFRKNGCEKCQAKTEADIEDGRDDMIEANKLADEYRSPDYEVFDTSNDDDDVFKRINKAFDNHKKVMPDVYSTLTTTAEMLAEDKKNYIFLVTREKFEADSEDSYDRYMWTYWIKNNVVSNEFDDRVEKHEQYVGKAFEKVFQENPSVDTLYIRNDDKEAFYEIEKVDDAYIEGPIPEVLYGADVFYESDNSEEDDE